MEDTKQNKLWRVGYFFIALIPIIFAFSMKGVYISGDDIYQLYFDNKGILDFLKNVDHGCVVSVFFLKFVGSFIPNILGIHPANNYVGILFRGINLAAITFLLNKFLSYYISEKKTKLLSYFFITITFLAFFSVMQDTEAYGCFFIMAKHCRYVFSMIPYLLFWYLIYKVFMEQVPLCKKQSVMLFVSAMWLGVSVESANISTLVSIALFLVFVFASKFFVKKQENALIKIFLNKKYIIIFSVFALGLFFALTNQGFTDIAEKRGIANAILNISEYFGTFLVRWVSLVFLFHHFWILTLSNILFSIFVLKNEPDKFNATRTVFFAWCLIFGISVFQLSLLTLGKTYYLEGKFWIEAGTLKFDTLIVQLVALCILLGKSFSLIDKQQVKDILKKCSVVSTIALIFALFTKNSIVAWNMYLIKNRQVLYKAEKMYLFYASKNQTAILSSDILNSMFYKEFLGIDGWERPGYITVLYPKIYSKIKPVNFVILPDDIAAKTFAYNGGKLSAEEIEKANFNNLLKEFTR